MVQRRPHWCWLTQQWSVTLPRSNIQMRVQHVCWEGCSHTSRHTGQGLATGFSSVCPQLTKHRYTEAHPVHFISAHRRVEIPVLTLFQICGLKVPGKYKWSYSEVPELFCSTKCSISFCVTKRRHKAGWAALISWGFRIIASSFTQWTSYLRVTRIVPEQRLLSSIPEDFIEDVTVCLRS